MALDQILDRLRQNNAARQTAADETRPKPIDAAARLGCTFCAGERVFDRRTGQEGTVIDATRESVIVSASH